MELDSTTTIREKINWLESQPIAWDKNQAWMRIERGTDKEESTKRFGYYAAAAVVVFAVAMIVGGDYTRDAGVVEGISNIEVTTSVDTKCGEGNSLPSPLRRGVGGEASGASDEVNTYAEAIIEPLVLLPEPIEGERIAIVEAPKLVPPPVERVHAIFGVEEQPSVAIIRQGKKLRIYFLQTEISQSHAINIDEPSGLEARINNQN